MSKEQFQPLEQVEMDQIFENIDELKDISDIEDLQKKIHSDYKLLAKEFSTSRIARVDAYLNKIEELQAKLTKNYLSHETFVQNNSPILDEQTAVSIDNNLNSFVPEFPKSPLLEPLPIFTDSFENLLKPHRVDLDALKKKFEYESNLIETNTRKNIELIWNQSIKDKIELRKRLRKQTFNKKISTELDYYNVKKNEKSIYNEKRFRISSKKVGDKRKNVELPYLTKVVNARNALQPKVILQPSNVASATDSEIHDDLELIKSSNTPIISKIEANYLYLEDQQQQKEKEQSSSTMTDLINNKLLDNKKATLTHDPLMIRSYQPHVEQPPQPQQPQLVTFKPQFYGPPTTDNSSLMARKLAMQSDLLHANPNNHNLPPAPTLLPLEKLPGYKRKDDLPPKGSFWM